MRPAAPASRAPALLAPTIACAALALALGGCSVDLSQVFSNTSGGQGAQSNVGGAGGSGGQGGTTSTTSATGGTTTTSTTTSTTTTSTTTTTTTTTTTSTGPGPVCGNGVCESAIGENTQNCPGDCPPSTCAHPVCDFGDALQDGCSPCVASVCAQDPKCCSDQWDGQCVGEANQLCNNVCCGDGACFAEQCDACVADCGHCPPAPTCPHTVCYGNDNAAPLNTTSCFDPCIDEVCATIDADTDNCCNPEPPSWSAECTDKAHALCPEYTCIKDVCAAMPSCCSAHWTGACVTLAAATPSCGTSCNCAHSPCSQGGQNQPLAIGCNPCVDAVCAADSYCCNNDWDGICVGEVATLCGVTCN